MKIAQIAPIGERVPPTKYGGTERFVYTLTEKLVEAGHDVTLFASGDSKTSGKLVSVYPKGLRDAKFKNPYVPSNITMLNIGNAYAKQQEFDIIHDHNGYMSLPTALLAKTPVVMTLHGALLPDSKRLFEGLKNNSNPYFVSISLSQRRPAPTLNYVSNIYHGLELNEYPYSPEGDGYLLFVGRINEEKGVHNAIEVAEFLDMPLIVAAKLDDCDLTYFKEKIEPRLNSKIKWIGEVDSDARNELMARALCFLHPVTWREPFGLAPVEAMACGTPVVAFGRGSIPEIIKNGKTGFIAEDVSEMIEMVRRIHEIKRKNCRAWVEQNFNADRMVREYEEAYEKVVTLHSEPKVNGNGREHIPISRPDSVILTQN